MYNHIGFGPQGAPALWLSGDARLAHSLVHVAFNASSRSAVDAFCDNGAPGIRAEYAPGYYAAFLFDPDGNNIEAVCRK